jgi:hypothetical protein
MDAFNIIYYTFLLLTDQYDHSTILILHKYYLDPL